jgi:hypothetical protein
MTNNRDLQEIQQNAESEVTRWSDPNFGGVDCLGYQGGRDFLASTVGGDTETDPRFAPIDDRGSVQSIKTAVEEMARDPEVRERIARETGNAGELERIDDETAEAAVWEFRRNNPGYFKSELNWEAMVRRMATKYLDWPDPDQIDAYDAYDELKRRGQFTSEKITATYRTLQKAGVLEVDPDSPRPLTENHKRAVALQAAAGDVEGAVTRYLQFRLPQQVSEMWIYSLTPQDALDDIADPKYKQILAEAVWFCWEHGRPNYSPTSDRRNFMQAYVAGRIPTARLLDEAWRSCQHAESNASRSGILGQLSEPEENHPENVETEIDRLNDSDVDRLYHHTLREYAKTARPVGVLA